MKETKCIRSIHWHGMFKADTSTYKILVILNTEKSLGKNKILSET